MANITPDVLFPNMTSDASGITIPYTDLAGLTQVEADPATGDGREVARLLADTIATKYLALATADRPAEMIVAKANPSGQGIDTIRQSYTLSFDVVLSQDGVTMSPEA